MNATNIKCPKGMPLLTVAMRANLNKKLPVNPALSTTTTIAQLPGLPIHCRKDDRLDRPNSKLFLKSRLSLCPVWVWMIKPVRQQVRCWLFSSPKQETKHPVPSMPPFPNNEPFTNQNHPKPSSLPSSCHQLQPFSAHLLARLHLTRDIGSQGAREALFTPAISPRPRAAIL